MKPPGQWKLWTGEATDSESERMSVSAQVPYQVN